jgi:hypothetical protein
MGEKEPRTKPNGNPPRLAQMGPSYGEVITGSNLYQAQDAQIEAHKVPAEARKAVARYRARDMNELIHKACLVVVYEDGSKQGHSHQVMAQSVALDVALGMDQD